MQEKVTLAAPGWGPLVCQGLLELYREKIGFNVAIYGGDGGVLDAHACVLMAASPTLKTWLASDPIQGCYSVEVSTISCDMWTVLLEFIYSGAVTVKHSLISDVLSAAEKLQMTPLAGACANALRTEPDTDDRTALINGRDDDRPELIANGHAALNRSMSSSLLPVQTGSDVRSKYRPASSRHGGTTSSVVAPANGVNSATFTDDDDARRRTQTHSQPTDSEDRKESSEQPLDLTKELSGKSQPFFHSPRLGKALCLGESGSLGKSTTPYLA